MPVPEHLYRDGPYGRKVAYGQTRVPPLPVFHEYRQPNATSKPRARSRPVHLPRETAEGQGNTPPLLPRGSLSRRLKTPHDASWCGLASLGRRMDWLRLLVTVAIAGFFVGMLFLYTSLIHVGDRGEQPTASPIDKQVPLPPSLPAPAARGRA